MPRLMLMCGLPGSGKTTLARELEAERDAVRLCPDEWLYDLGQDGHDSAARLRVEQLQWKLARRLLSLGQDVILENGFWLRAERKTFFSLGRALGAEVELHYLAEQTDELCRRLTIRNADLPPATFRVSRADLMDWASWFEAPSAEELASFDSPPLVVAPAA